jgi:hypothetical protein
VNADAADFQEFTDGGMAAFSRARAHQHHDERRQQQ